MRATRRDILQWLAITPAVSGLMLPRAFAATRDAGCHDGRVVVVVRMMGGNDGLNTVIPMRDDIYYRSRPNIAIAKQDCIAVADGDLGLHPALADFHAVIDDGFAGIVQGVGYPQSSRSHSRATEIWETAALDQPTPETGWLGRYLDACDCASNSFAGVQFGDTFGRTLASAKDRARLIGSPELVAAMNAEALRTATRTGPANDAFKQLSATQHALADTADAIQRAQRGSGKRHAYPDTAFGDALRWTANMIETESAVRVYYLSVGSFEPGAPSFDTHVDQLPAHETLYRELGRGVRAFASHLRAAGQFDRVTLLTFSDFGRQLTENATRGTEHGDSSVLLYAGGAVRAGIQGRTPDLASAVDGGLPFAIDFRSIYADVMTNWLGAPATTLPFAGIEPYSIVQRT
jgi:uncharacterized protein (DUF1501 family)